MEITPAHQTATCRGFSRPGGEKSTGFKQLGAGLSFPVAKMAVVNIAVGALGLFSMLVLACTEPRPSPDTLDTAGLEDGMDEHELDEGDIPYDLDGSENDIRDDDDVLDGADDDEVDGDDDEVDGEDGEDDDELDDQDRDETTEIIPLRQESSPFGLHGIEDDAESMALVGIRWFRPGLHPGSNFWERRERFDTRYRSFLMHDINILENLLVFNDGQDCLPDDLERAAETTIQIVERYDGDGFEDAPAEGGIVPVVRYWQIGNEVDLGTTGQSCSPAQYVEALAFYSAIIREHCHDCKVLMSGLAGDPATYLDAALQLGAADYYDINDVHVFGDKNYYRTLPEIHEQLTAVQRAHGVDREIWLVETGTHSGAVNGQNYQSEDEQAAALVKIYTTALASGFGKIIWAWGLYEGFGGDGNQFFDQTGLIYDGTGEYDRGAGVRKKAYYAYGVMTSLLAGCDPRSAARQSHENDDVWVYHFEAEDGGSGAYVVWKEYSGGLIDPDEHVPVAMTGASAMVAHVITNELGTIEQYELPIEDGSVALVLLRGPVIVIPH